VSFGRVNRNLTFSVSIAHFVGCDAAERVTTSGVFPNDRSHVRAVFCPECRTHYTTEIPLKAWRSHKLWLCAECGGNGLPYGIDVPS
jgi:hypothetical protein